MNLDLIPRAGRRLFLLLRLCLLAAFIAPLGLTFVASGEAVQITPPPPPAGAVTPRPVRPRPCPWRTGPPPMAP